MGGRDYITHVCVRSSDGIERLAVTDRNVDVIVGTNGARRRASGLTRHVWPAPSSACRQASPKGFASRTGEPAALCASSGAQICGQLGSQAPASTRKLC